MPFDSKDVANTILDIGEERGIRLSPMKLQKLLYFAHGWHLAILDKPLLNEAVEAWEFGPVINSVYHEFKRYGRAPIRARASRFRSDTGHIVEERIPTGSETEPSLKLIEQVWNIYAPFSPIQLSNMTHLPDSPWHLAVEGAGKPFPRGIVIPDDEIQAYFKRIAERHHAAKQSA